MFIISHSEGKVVYFHFNSLIQYCCSVADVPQAQLVIFLSYPVNVYLSEDMREVALVAALNSQHECFSFYI